MVQRITPVQVLRGSNMDPYILNKRPDDPYDKGSIRTDESFFVQTLEDYLRDFVPSNIPYADITNYKELVKHRCIAVIERGVYLYRKNLIDRVEKLYLPAIEKGAIPDDHWYKLYTVELRFEDEERFERFFTEAIKKGISYLERIPENEVLFKSVDNLEADKLQEFLGKLSESDKALLKIGILKSLGNALLRIELLYVPVIKEGSVPDTPDYNHQIVQLGLQDRDELKEKLFYFLRNALCLTNWNDDPALRSDERAFRSCID